MYILHVLLYHIIIKLLTYSLSFLVLRNHSIHSILQVPTTKLNHDGARNM